MFCASYAEINFTVRFGGTDPPRLRLIWARLPPICRARRASFYRLCQQIPVGEALILASKWITAVVLFSWAGQAGHWFSRWRRHHHIAWAMALIGTVARLFLMAFHSTLRKCNPGGDVF
jgi:hypothetical protein